MNLNTIIIGGNLTRDPEVKYTQGGTAICTLGLANNRRWADRDGKEREDVCFVDVATFGKTAENCGKFLVKGAAVCVQGRLKMSKWIDKDGNPKSKLSIDAERVEFLGGKTEKKETDAEKKETDAETSEKTKDDDEIPF